MSRISFKRVGVTVLVAGGLAGIIYFRGSTREPEGGRAAGSGSDVAEGTVRVAWPEVAATRAGAAAGDAVAQAWLGRMLAEGRGMARHYGEAAGWYRRAADQGLAEGQYRLAELYEAGQGVAMDFGEAARWYRLAAEQGHAGAQFGLGVLHEFGRGVARDQAAAAGWYLRAAKQGDAQAQFNLGQRYSLGVGVVRDPVAARMWLELAARQGIPDAARASSALLAGMSAEQRAEAARRVEAFVAGRP